MAVLKDNGTKEDYIHTEDNGKLQNANPKDVSERAKTRGMPQLDHLDLEIIF